MMTCPAKMDLVIWGLLLSALGLNAVGHAGKYSVKRAWHEECGMTCLLYHIWLLYVCPAL